MSEELAAQLFLRLGWYRVKDDLEHRTFVKFPFEVQMIELNLDEWLDVLQQRVRDDRYVPSAPILCEIPKPKGAIRPGMHLTLEDRVVYLSAVGACLPQLHESLAWAQRTVDYSYQLADDPDAETWMRGRFNGWSAFRNESLRLLAEEGYSYLVSADITAYYDLIDIGTLISELRAIGAPRESVRQIGDCLNRWATAVGPGRGIPQGNSGSDLLAKLYLNAVDHALADAGFKHLRYVDDFRIFCHSRVEAQRALMLLAKLLRQRGLHVASEKLAILPADQARTEIEGIVPTLRAVQARLAQRLIDALGSEDEDPYLGAAEIDRLLADNPDDTPIEVIEEAYQTYFIDRSEAFDKTLFHYLLNRLRKARSRAAVSDCARILHEHPYETWPVLQYWAGVGVADDVIESVLVPFVQSDRAVYDYQRYQILSWMLGLVFYPPAEAVACVRELTFDARRPSYLRAVARQLLGRWGNEADLEQLLFSYNQAGNDLDRAGVLLSLGRLEVGRRNSFLARVERESPLTMRAAVLVRDGAI